MLVVFEIHNEKQTFSLNKATLASATALTENGNKPIDILMQLNTAMIVYACKVIAG